MLNLSSLLKGLFKGPLLSTALVAIVYTIIFGLLSGQGLPNIRLIINKDFRANELSTIAAQFQLQPAPI